MRKLFGTDGVRGIANQYPMTAQMAVRLGQAVAHHFRRNNKRRTRILVGKDTRLSGYMFESALAAGVTSVGADVMFVGPLPTPGIAFLTTDMRADAGIVISASHNNYRDNGIKLFAADGYKLPDAVELQLESLVLNDSNGKDIIEDSLNSELIGRARRYEDATGRYIVFLKAAFPKKLTLSGLKIVVDCANGAAYKVAPTVLEELGAEVIALGNAPNGTNINHRCGSNHPNFAAARVLESGADLGITLDGDADRVILIDEKGQLVDGDNILALCAPALKRQGLLPNDTVVATVMSNLGLELSLAKHDIKLVRTKVGDRYVVEEMRKFGHTLGGEQSGHLIFRDFASTGDGMVAALQVLGIMQTTGKPLSELTQVMQAMPQTLINVQVSNKPPLKKLKTVQKTITDVSQTLGDQGRVLVRYSGTENKARVMVEGADSKQILQCATAIADALKAEIGAN